MHLGVAVDLAGRGQEEPGRLGLGQAQAVVGAQAADLEDLDGDAREVGRRGRAGEVQHRIDLARHPDVLADVVLHEREPGPTEEVLDVVDRPREQVVDGDDLVVPGQQCVAQV
jgi:hypothetical protein